jgi:hypothetical protein
MNDIKKEIVRLLEENGFEVEYREEKIIVLSLPTKHYQDKNGENSLPVLITTSGEDKIIMIIVPFCYVLSDEVNIPMLHEYFLVQNTRHPLIKFGFDPSDGEIQARVDIILGDEKPSFSPIGMAFHSLIRTMESIHEEVTELFAHKPTFEHEEKEKAESIINSVLKNNDNDTDDDIWL